MNNTAERGRSMDPFFQMIRGICILAVVMLHCPGTDITFSSFNGLYFVFLINAINSPVAVFFFLSGYFVNAEKIHNGGTALWLKKRVVRLLLPYAVWTVLYFVMDLILGRTLSAGWVMQCIFLGKAATPLYYIVVLICYSLLTPLLVKFMRKRGFVFLVFFGSAACLVLFYVLSYAGYPVWDYLRYTLVWMPFYFGGILARNSSVNFEKYRRSSVVVIICTFILEIAESYAALSCSADSIVLSQMKISSLLNSAAIVFLILSFRNVCVRDNAVVRALVALGNDSYMIFFVHCIFVTMLNILLGKLSFAGDLPLPLIRVCSLIIIMALSLLTIRIIRLIFRNKSKLIFGG